MATPYLGVKNVWALISRNERFGPFFCRIYMSNGRRRVRSKEATHRSETHAKKQLYLKSFIRARHKSGIPEKYYHKWRILEMGQQQIGNSRNVLPLIRNSQNVLQQMENSWNGPAANPEVPKCASTNQEYLKCDSRFLVSHFKNSPFVVALFGNSWFVAGPYKRF